ncbi:DUF4973 domain-containing protein [Sphingobacterium sp. T2]|uniref:DUF4973 domain-containing protein n=1 Tax=Sphingobacterium sp. T2 TaxID=1590596 RepID=UPI00397869AC
MLLSACNDEWKEEQYERYISFKAPLNNEGVSNIFVRYRGNEKTTFQLPLIVSGSTTNDQNISVNIGLDMDTLETLNFERFQNRTDFYYKILDKNFYSLPSKVDIKSRREYSLTQYRLYT